MHPAVKAQLERRLPELSFDGVPFAEVFAFLGDVTGAKFEIDWTAIEAAGVNRNTKVAVHFKNATFADGLRMTLDAAAAEAAKAAGGGDVAALDYAVGGGVIRISTRDALRPAAAAPTPFPQRGVGA